MIDFSRVITQEDKAAAAIEALATVERVWRNTELARADVELNKVQDGVGTGAVGAWREYRIALRDLPEHADFPNEGARPVAPDNKE